MRGNKTENWQGAKVLIIEDNEEDQLVLKRFFKTQCNIYDFQISSSVQEAIDELKTKEFDAIVSDFNLGDGTAEDVLNYIKRKTLIGDEQPIDIAFIIVTGGGNEETAVKIMKMGASDYIIKDLNYNYLKILPLTIERAIKRINVEKEVHEKNQILSGILNNVPIIVFKTDENGNLIELIGSGLDRFRIPNRNLKVKKNLFEIFINLTQSMKKGINLVFQNPGRSTNFVSEIKINNISGHFDNYLFYYQHSKEGGSIGFSIDITEKKKADAQLTQVYQGVHDVFAKLSEESDKKLINHKNKDE